MLNKVQKFALKQRFDNRRLARSEKLHTLCTMLAGKNVDARRVESLDRQAARAMLMSRADLTWEVEESAGSSRKIFEAVVGRNDRLPCSFLPDGAKAANAVCRVISVTPDGMVTYGTGFSIAPGLIMTNNHVLPAAETAARSQAEFGYWSQALGADGQTMRVDLSPGDVFITDPELDFTIVGLDPQVAAPLFEAVGAIELLPSSGKALVGEPVNVIQHGDGEAQTISIRDNVVVDVFDNWIHYTSDTSPGASGSPVLNDQWQLAALHHASIEHRGADGSVVVVNEGVRVSAILDRLDAMLR